MAGIVTIGESGNSVNTSQFNWQQALRDTEYTHPSLYDDGEPYVYHCGIDIFNNHRLRANGFVYIDKVGSASTENPTFNTLLDFVRDYDGDNLNETVSYVNSASTDVHIYRVDNVMTMEEAFVNRITEENGWFGFINKTDIDIPNAVINDEEVSINKVLNNNKACEFIDLYPDRSLFSFIPKYNKYRNRTEKNWDYCITYPYENDYAKYNEVVGLNPNLPINNGGSSVKILSNSIIRTQSGNKLIRMKTMFKHTLDVGSYIKLYYKIGEELQECKKLLMVYSIGDDSGNDNNSFFAIKFNDIAKDFQIIESGSTSVLEYEGEGEFNGFYYKKVVNGVDCQYYLRKFKKLKNKDDKELASDVNKLAYGENIYGDRLAQIIYTDDIDVEGLLDNNGRPLTKLYFTVIKRNAGHDIWYNDGDITNDTIEFSHCFGEVKSGFDLPEEVDDFNVRKIHGIDISNLDSATINALNLVKSPKSLEDNLTIDNDIFYGDIVEFNQTDYSQNIIEVVQHRFNTAQRETLNEKFKNILYDRLQYDDYDAGIMPEASGFTVISGYTNEYNGEEFYGNLNPEGYFYNPFSEIVIREESDIVSTVIGTTLRVSSVSGGSLRFVLTTAIDYNIMKGDTIALYNNETKTVKWLLVEESNGVTVTLVTDDSEATYDVNNSLFVKTNEGVPFYASYVPSTHTFVWRAIREFSELTNDSELYDMPFANGCHYIHENVNLFVKRQDPEGNYGLLPTNPLNPLINYSIPGNGKIDMSFDNYFDFNKLKNPCY